MFVLLQIYPLEAAGDDDLTPLDAIAVHGSQEQLEEYLVGYQARYRAACAEFAARDPNPDGDWTFEHDRRLRSSRRSTASTAASFRRRRLRSSRC